MPGSSGQPTRMDYPSPRGVHVPESMYTAYPYPATSFDFDGSDRGPGGSTRSGGPAHRNRYSRSQQTPRIRDVTWISSPEQPPPSTIAQSPQLQPHTQHAPTQTQFPTPRGTHVMPSSPWRPPPSPLQAPRSPSPSHFHSSFPAPVPAPFPTHSPTPSRAHSLAPRPASPFRPPSTIPPSPAPTVGEHMALDDAAFALTFEEMLDPYGYQRPPPHPIGGGSGVIKSLWRGLKKLTGFRRTSSFGSANMSMPAPIQDMPMPVPTEMSGEGMPAPMEEMPVPVAALPGQPPSEATQYVDPPSVTPTPPETLEEQHSPRARSTHSHTRSYTRTPRVIPGLLRRSRTPSPRVDSDLDLPPVTVTIVSPTESPSPSPMPTPSPSSMPIPGPAWSTQSARRTSPAKGVPRHPAIVTHGEDNTPGRMPTPIPAPAPMPVPPPVASQSSSGPGEDANVAGGGAPRVVAFDMPVPIPASIPMPQPHPLSPSSGTMSSTVMGRVRRFAAKIDSLPWVSDAQIANEYVPEANPRSRLRTRVRKGADPSWYNARPEEVGKRHGPYGYGYGYEHNYDWSGWDMWAKQSAAGLMDEMRTGMHGTEGLGLHVMPEAPVYPHGYAPVIPHPSGFPVYPQPGAFG